MNRGHGIGFIFGLWLAAQLLATPNAVAQKPAEVPQAILDFIAAGEKARLERIAFLKSEIARLTADPSHPNDPRITDYREELNSIVQGKGPYAPVMPETPKVADKGRLTHRVVKILQVIDERTMLIGLEGPWSFTKSKKDDLVVALRGFPTDTIADKQRYTVLVPLVISGTEDLRDGSRRTVLVAEPLDMRPYEAHWAAAKKKLKIRRP